MATQERLEADCRALEMFCFVNPDYVRVTSHTPDLRHYLVRLDLQAPVAKGDGYEILPSHEIAVDIPDNYLCRDRNGAFVKSRIRRVGQSVFHPNSWASDGMFCFDRLFGPHKTLADQVHTVISLMQYRLINVNSPADYAAGRYFREHAEEIRSRINQVTLRLPRFDIHVVAREMPRLMQ